MGIPKAVVLVAALLIGVGVAVLIAGGPRLAPEGNEEGSTAAGTRIDMEPQATIVPTGSAGPIYTETATFSLG